MLGYTSQARFLLDCGLLELMREAPGSAAANTAALRLLSEAEMGELLKVVAVTTAKRAAPAVAALAAGAVIGFLLGRRNRKAQMHPAALKADDLLAALTRLVS